MERTITVVGKSRVTMTPDVTRVTITNQMLKPDYTSAYQQSTENNYRFSECMKQCQLDPKLLKTTRFDIEKHFEYKYDKYNNGTNIFKGYMLTQVLKIDLGMDNAVLSNLVSTIGRCINQDIEIEIGYTIKDPRPAELRMLEKAVKDAKEKAEIMAKAADCILDTVASIDGADNDVSIYFKARRFHDSDEAMCCETAPESLDITPTDLSANREVKVTWYIRRSDKE